MADFAFDPDKSFDENVAAFRAHVEVRDPECARILFDNLDTLTGDGDPSRARQRRAQFNATVAQVLDALAARAAGTP